MDDYKTYRSNLWTSIVNFFTFSTPYDEEIIRIQKMDIGDAFMADTHKLHRDFVNSNSTVPTYTGDKHHF